MNIRILVASNDKEYAIRLAGILERTTPHTGDVFEIALFTDNEKLIETLADSKSSGRVRFDIALIDEEISNLVLGVIPVVLLLTEEDARNGTQYAGNSSAVYVNKYQRVSDIVKNLLLALASLRSDIGIGSGIVCAFYSPIGGSGTSTLAAAFAMELAKSGIKPLYVSFEYFNGSELMFGEDNTVPQGLYDVFYAIADGGGVTATIDAVKTSDSSGVSFLKKFPFWTEVIQRTPDEIQTFINAARSAHEIDIIVLDLGSGFASFTERALQCADEIFVVVGVDPVSDLKLKALFDEETYFFQDFLNKTSLIYNKAPTNPQKSFGCKTSMHVPHKLGVTAKDIAASAGEHLRGLVNPAWKQQR